LADASPDKLAFVFEMIRHGARAGLIDGVFDGPSGFTVPTGMLTPEGMRQRYLYGQMNREKYVQGFGNS
jgi:hypothetical protein